jgi:hypothetical protein
MGINLYLQAAMLRCVLTVCRSLNWRRPRTATLAENQLERCRTSTVRAARASARPSCARTPTPRSTRRGRGTCRGPGCRHYERTRSRTPTGGAPLAGRRSSTGTDSWPTPCTVRSAVRELPGSQYLTDLRAHLLLFHRAELREHLLLFHRAVPQGTRRVRPATEGRGQARCSRGGRLSRQTSKARGEAPTLYARCQTQRPVV